MLRMRDRSQSPPDGWLYTQPETGWFNRKHCPETLWDFKALRREVIRHRMSRPDLKLSTDQTEVEMDIDNQNARRVAHLRGNHTYDDSPPPPISRVFRKNKPNSRGIITVRRSMALGDVLASTCVAKKLAEQGYGVQFQATTSSHCILQYVPYLLGVDEPNGNPVVNLDGCYENNQHRNKLHFHDMFIDKANEQLRDRSIVLPKTNCSPLMEVSPHSIPMMENYPRPWVMICPKSNNWIHRTVPDRIWMEAAAHMRGTKFWMGMDPINCKYIVDLGIRHFDNVIHSLSVADLMISVDTGPMHVAAAMGVPTIAILQSSSPELHLSDQQDYVVIKPDLDCLNCQQHICPKNANTPPCQTIDARLIADTANSKLGNGVAAVIPIFRPTAERLNRCLKAVLPQVEQVIVTRESLGAIPHGVITDPKITYVVKQQSGIGFGKNVNYGFRHTNHPWVLILNDDVYLEPDVINKLMSVVTPDVGMVAHLLRYPDGKIEHGGTYRAPGAMGWGHIDHRASEPTIKEPVEMENVCGASVLVRRKAFYQAGGFDEDFFMYCEDNALCLQIRHAGWRIMYNPLACGIHESHQSSQHLSDLATITAKSCAILENKWGWYLRENPHADLRMRP